MAYLILGFFYTIFKTYLQIKICILSKRVSVQEHRQEYSLADLRETEDHEKRETEDVEK